MSNDYLFTSESVSEGHPDKVADQISDAILDAILAQDPLSRVAAETLTNTGLVVLAGEITTQANVDYIQVARDTIKRIGYDNTEYGIDYKGCAVLVAYDKQSNDIAQGVDRASDDYLNIGAGDQGLMFGYACDETPELMPAAIYYAHRLVERQAQLRKDGRLPFLRPDAKGQITLRYVDGKPVGIDTVVLILGFTGWTGMYRQVRAEFIKHRSREYVRAAEAIGASRGSRMFRHILPNVSHVVLVRMSLLVVGFIKAEVILSYLGLGVPVDQVSWGTMLAEAQSELILGHWWQLAAATLFMAVFVTAFSLMADAWRDALDPKLRGLE